MMSKLVKKKMVLCGVILLLLLPEWFGECSGFCAAIRTAKVVRGNLVQTVDATGKVESADEIGLRFESSGKISNIYKQVGEQVGRDDSDVEFAIFECRSRQASANVKSRGGFG